ncbi:MAG: ROK family protein, partial [Pseudomonadota bacterium]|nr:ROK family protein [Pseudomonadota bacterium]
AGDRLAPAACDDDRDRLARARAPVRNLVDPAVRVLGGGMSNVAALYTAVPAVWARYIFSDSVRTQLRPPTHGDSSGVRGAAWL